MRKEHPLIVALVEAFARKAGIDPPMLWRALDGLPSDPKLVEGLVGAFHPMVRSSDFVLSSGTEDSTIRTMRTMEIDSPRRGRPLKRGDHKFIAALKKAGVTLAVEAATVGRSTTSLRFFCMPKDSDNHRPIPRKLALYWKEKYGVPTSAWADIAND